MRVLPGRRQHRLPSIFHVEVLRSRMIWSAMLRRGARRRSLARTRRTWIAARWNVFAASLVDNTSTWSRIERERSGVLIDRHAARQVA